MARKHRNAEDWRRAVFRTRATLTTFGEVVRVGGDVRTMLIYLADFMSESRKVSRPRHLIARDMGVSERMVTRWLGDAVTSELLARTLRGQKGVTAEYVGLFPTIWHEPNTKTPNSVGQQGVPLNAPVSIFQDGNSVPLNGLSAGQQGVPPEVSTADQFTPCEECDDYGCSVCCGQAVSQ